MSDKLTSDKYKTSGALFLSSYVFVAVTCTTFQTEFFNSRRLKMTLQ